MNLTLFDWAILVVSVVALRFVSLRTRSHMKGVADFLSANRSAGRYLLTIASQMGAVGSVAFVAMWEIYSQAGFTYIWWGFMQVIVTVVIILTGWVFYRFRETRALTLAQFLEMRYNRRFRIFAGFTCWASGVINFGIFPVVTARFFVYFCGLPDHFMLGPFSVPTIAPVMAIDLLLALTFVNMGGQITVMVTDCVQGIFSMMAMIVIALVVLWQVNWPQIAGVLSAAPSDASMLNPFQTSQMKDFNIWFYLIAIFGSFYGYLSWQGTQGFYNSAKNPHEQKMGGLIAIWRDLPRAVMTVLLGVAALAALKLPEYSHVADQVQASLGTIQSAEIQNQMRVPVALAHILPIGIKGLLATTMLFFSFTNHDTYMHSWGTIFVQDVVMPIRRRPLDPHQHIRYLRWSIIGVAAFAFLFSLFYPQTQMIIMFMAITGTIWTGGSGAVIIGGLYWRKGTTAAAYAALILGAVLGVGGLIVPNIYLSHYGVKFPINGQWLWMMGMVGASLVYIVVSLATNRGRSFNLARMLNRDAHTGRQAAEGRQIPRPSKWMQLIGIGEEFSRWDRVLAVAAVVWNFGWLAVFCIVALLNYTIGVPDSWWPGFWHFWIWLYLGISIPSVIWLMVGGVRDIRSLLKTLDTAVRDHTDDGRVFQEPDGDALPSVEPELERQQ